MVEKDKGQAGRLFRTAAGCRMGAVGEVINNRQGIVIDGEGSKVICKD